MGTVYRAVDSQTGDLVALKLLAEDCLVSDAEPRFLHEGWILESVHHPRVVRFRELGRAGPGCWFLAMDYVPGPSLRERLSQGALRVHEALEIADQLLDALGAVHATGVTHRDLKPANILLGERKQPDVRLIDFGLAKVPDHALTQAGVFVGSPRYASTEQLRGAHVDARADLFAVGALLYAMLTGQAPFPGRSAREVMVQHRVQRPGRPSVARGERLPVGLDALVLRLLLPEPEARPSRADDVRRELARIRVAPLDSQRRVEARRDPESFEATVRSALPRGRLQRAWRRLQRFSA
jgi:serine/threonine-protein kinase